MHRSPAFLLAVIAASGAALAAMAQTPPRPPKPYQPVAIMRPAALDDLTFALFRAALAVAVKTRRYAELAPFVLERGFFWGRDFGQRFDPRKPSADNLAVAIALEHGNGNGRAGPRGVPRGAPVRAVGIPPRRHLRAGAAGLRHRRLRETRRYFGDE